MNADLLDGLPSPRQLGFALRILREAHGFRLKQASEVVGLSASKIGQLERGEVQDPGYYSLEAFARAYGKSVEEIKEFALHMAGAVGLNGWWDQTDPEQHFRSLALA